jgi:RNA polymerase sigma-54 factor
MKARAQLSPRQSTKLTPQLQLALKLLQCTQTELEQEIDNALAANPILERVDADTEAAALPNAPADFSDEAEAGDSADVDADFRHTATPEAEESLWDLMPEPKTLRSHLGEQLQLSALSRRDLAIGEALIDSLDEDGYCQASAEELRTASALAPPAKEAEIEAIRHLIQRFDPVGVASRSLSECLQVQLTQIAAKPALMALATDIALRHLDVLARGGATAVAKAGGFDSLGTAEAVALLKTLDPKPGALFQHSRTEYVEPDFAVLPKRNGWQVQGLRDAGQQLRLNAYYLKLARNSRGADAAHLAQYLQEARWLIAGIASRRDTLLKVVKAVVRKQTPFLDAGPSALQAMSMREIAESIRLHESTVSRACSGKWLATPHGMIELGSLFGSGITDDSGTVQAAGAVQSQIADLIAGEPAGKPLSDAKLEQLLAARGLPVARRTIAKYREALGIPPSHLRKKSP